MVIDILKAIKLKLLYFIYYKMLSGKSLVSWFKDGCDFNKKGKAVRGPGFFCWAYLILLIIGVVASTFIFLYSSYKDVRDDSYNVKFMIFSVLNILWSLIIISFMYNMCRICRPWTGLGVLILVGFVYRFVQQMFFQDMYDKMIDTTMNLGK